MPHFIVVMRDSSMHLVGPFPHTRALASWGHNPANNPDDDPRWQSIELDDPSQPLRIVSPDTGPM